MIHDHPLPKFRWRTESCGSCGGSGMRGCMIGSGFSESECFDCGGEGTWNNTCSDCCEEKPLDEQGQCLDCSLMAEVDLCRGDPLKGILR